MLFVLNAIDPTRHHFVLETLRSTLKPQGCVLFRDYGLYDLSQLKFPIGHRVGENTYFAMHMNGSESYLCVMRNPAKFRKINALGLASSVLEIVAKLFCA